ncbi:MAG: YnbE family lipoprotein [Pseudomonadota bacterium]
MKRILAFTYAESVRATRLFYVLALGAALTACAPTVKVAAPEEPITINLNVKIEHEIKVKVEKDLEDVFSEDSDLF